MAALWLGLLVRSSIILLSAAILHRFPRRLAATDRHRILLAGFVLLLVWPAFSALLPAFHLPIWTGTHSNAAVTVRQIIFIPGRITAPPAFRNWPLLVWAAGVLFSLAPVLIGYLKVLVVARRASPLNDTGWNCMLDELCREFDIRRHPRLLVTADPLIPMTFGLMRASVLLPSECLNWQPARRRTVLLHEFAHVRRHDVHSYLFASILTGLWWFQPLCWLNRRSLRRDSERACDALVLASGVRPSDYAVELLNVARQFRSSRPWSSAAITMARRGELETRLYHILDNCPSLTKSKLPMLAVSLLTLLALSASAISLSPVTQPGPSRGSHMKRTVLSGLLISAGLSAATIGGSLFDPSGSVVPGAQALLFNPETSTKLETATAEDGKFAFENLPAGEYILRIQKPGFASLFREFKVEADTNVERGLTLDLGHIEERLAVQAEGRAMANPPGTINPKQLRVGGSAAQSRLVRKVQPVYPTSAKAAGLQGRVELETVISKDGVPLDIRVVSSPGDDLTESALDAVRQWRYTPTLLNGQPVEIVTDVLVNYTLSQ